MTWISCSSRSRIDGLDDPSVNCQSIGTLKNGMEVGKGMREMICNTKHWGRGVGLLVASFMVVTVVGAQEPIVSGHVFNDLNRDGVRQADEPGIQGVKVSNGEAVVATGPDGSYVLPVRDDMSLMVIQPSGYSVPLNEHSVPQFSDTHKPAGSASDLRFGGLAPTGPMPETVDFPLTPWGSFDQSFRCAVIGDAQTYSNDEVGFFRDSALIDLLGQNLRSPDCMIYLGDVVGDDLDLLDRMMAVGGQIGVPQWFVFGNHDLDFDATTPADRADTWRAKVGPDYYAFEIGEVLFVTLNNIVYPCGEFDLQRPGRERCGNPERPGYNARVEAVQMRWLENLLKLTPKDKRVVVMHHAPFVSFVDASSGIHQTDNASEVHALLAGRPAVSLSGHTHSLENHDPGQTFEGWETETGVEELPFRHIVAGAGSGGWYQGDLDINGIPMALQRMGAPKGVLMLAFDGTDYVESYQGSRIDPNRRQWVSLNTPQFRKMHQAIAEWMASPEAREEGAIPPYSLHDLGDRGVVTRDDLSAGVSLVANVWLGSASTEVVASINGGRLMTMQRTQAGAGEGMKKGPEFADPFSTARLMSVARSAVVSSEGDPRAQGYETFKGRANQGTPRPQGRGLPDHNMHLWTMPLPQDLPLGVHHIEITSTDRHRRVSVDHLIVEVVDAAPERFWRTEPWSE